jgi:hypothetical protein
MHCELPTTEYDFFTAGDGKRLWVHRPCMSKAGLRLTKDGRLDDGNRLARPRPGSQPATN